MVFDRVKMGLGCIDLTRENSEIIDQAIEKGIRCFDTSDCYGPAHESEIALGEKLKNHDRNSVIICTKVGVQFKADGIHLDGTPEYIASSCDASLKRLQTEYIDLYYLHRVDPKTPIEESVKALKRLVEAKNINHIGLSEVSADQIRRAHKIHPITAVQIEYSPWSRQDENNAVIETCRQLHIAVVAYSPLGRAFFTKQSRAYFEELPTNDYRKRLPRYTGKNLEINFRLKQELAQIATVRGCTLAQIVLAWEMAKGIIPIPGITKLDNLEENIHACVLRLSSSVVAVIDMALNRSKFAGLRYPSVQDSAIYPEEKEAAEVTKSSSAKSLVFYSAGALAAGLLFARIANTTITPSVSFNLGARNAR